MRVSANADAGLVNELIDDQGLAEFVRKKKAGYRVVERKTFDGRTMFAFTPPPIPQAQPRLALIEAVRMSSYLGDYGAGRTISTFSLLLGERHEITLKTYKRSKTTASQASSILDSFEETTGEEFASDLATENSSKDSSESNFSYHTEAEASARANSTLPPTR